MARLHTFGFEEYPEASITLRVGPVPALTWFDLIARWDAWRVSPNTVESMREGLEIAAAIADAGFVESWTFAEPPTGEGMRAQDYHVAIQIANQWMREVGRVPRPLLPSASGGTPSTSEANPPSDETPG
jgi:hypothetical protein